MGPYVGDARVYLGPGDYWDVRRSGGCTAWRKSREARQDFDRGAQGRTWRGTRGGSRSPVVGVAFRRIGDGG
jgi:hypothetical protein